MNSVSIPELFDRAGFQCAAMIICAVAVFYSIVRSKPEKMHNKLFVFMLVNVFFTALAALTSALARPFVSGSDTAFFLLEGCQYVYFVLHCMLAPAFTAYVICLSGYNYEFKGWKRAAFVIPPVVMLIMALINPLVHWLYRFDENRSYVRGAGLFVPYVVGLIYYLIAGRLVLRFWRILNRRRKMMMAFFFIIVALGVIIQFLFYPVHTELFTQAIGLVGLMVTVENEEDLIDPRTHIYNHIALEYRLRMFEKIGLAYGLIILKLKNQVNFLTYSGSMGMGAITAMNADFLETLVPKSSIYYAGAGSFAVVLENTDREYNLELARRIRERYEHTWHLGERDVRYSAAVLCADVPKDISSVDDIMMLMGSPVSEVAKRSNDVLSGESLRYIVRQNLIDRAIISGFEKKHFEVYYQPIYKAIDLSICACEALVRLHDDEYGDIYPEEFLPLAERSGAIFEIGDFVLGEVCNFLNSGIPTEMGVARININLSVSQCTQPLYADRVINTISKYSIDPSKIAFEIKEAAVATDHDQLKSFISKLKKYGCSFGIDNFGTGSSNIALTSSAEIDIVKLDRTMIKEAQKSQVGRIILENTASMFRRLGKQILVTGIEEKEQIDLIAEYDIDLLQGYYFSNPLSQNELISILKATQLARLEEQKALAASEAMSNFLASMSHEIRTPINAVLGMDEMILRECCDGQILEYARNIEGAGRTLLSLINDILDFSKLEAGNFQIVEGVYELSTLVSDVMNMIKIKADSKGLELKCEVEPTTPEKLLGDETRIRQILLNLMNNAVKYTEKGCVTLKVNYEKTGKDSIKLLLSVKDTGIGIREEDRAKLFDKFTRLDTEKNKTVEGSGLGLAITNLLIKNMNGAIDVESIYGQGSVFYVIIPQKVISRTAVGDVTNEGIEDRPKEEVVAGERFHAPEARVLLVDDTPMNLAVVRALLKRTRVLTEEALSGAEALAMMQEKPYDLVLLDYRMPEMDGIEVLKRIRKLENNPNSSIPVIALTANAISGARERFLAEGFDDYITKPVDGERLEKMLMVYLPADKIKLGASRAAQEQAAEDAPKEEVREEGADIRTAIDRAAGIKNCGSEEVYETVLQIFIDDIDNKCETVRKALEDGDIGLYTVEVHSLKSSARTVGAMELSELAAQLEAAGDGNDLDRINADTERLLNMYAALRENGNTSQEAAGQASGTQGTQGTSGTTGSIGTVGTTDTERDDNGTADGAQSANGISHEEWRDALETVKEFAQLMDYDNAAMILRSLNSYEMTESSRKKVHELKTLVDALKWDEVNEKIDRILA